MLFFSHGTTVAIPFFLSLSSRHRRRDVLRLHLLRRRPEPFQGHLGRGQDARGREEEAVVAAVWELNQEDPPEQEEGRREVKKRKEMTKCPTDAQHIPNHQRW